MPSNQFSVANKKVILTGAAGGIGSALLCGFLTAGATVIAVTRQDTNDWNGLDVLYKQTLVPIKCDLSNKLQIMELIHYVEANMGGCDVLINNASGCSHSDENIYSLETLKDIMAVSLEAPYLLCGQIAQQMAKQGHGSIINITSINAERALPRNPSYITAKGALKMLTKAIARDFGQHGVRANNLCPGYIHTKMTHTSFITPDLYEERRNHTMLGRWGVPEDIVGPCIFLASEASSYITGTDIHVEGGWLAKGL